MAKAIPLITIIGVPNTGKSTLFNRLIGQRKALVHSDSGMTRDIFKKSFEINGKEYYLQDSGGFFPDNTIITDEINKRIFKEAKKSDLIIFLFDGKRELLGYEKDLFLEIKKINTNVVTVINKVDNPDKFILSPSYYALKEDFLFISAEHNLEIEELVDIIEEKLRDYHKPLASYQPSNNGKADARRAIKSFDQAFTKGGWHPQPIRPPAGPPEATRISIIGKPNVGKSSIINKILKDDAVIVSPIPGTTRDSVDLEFKRKNKTFILVDNAGIRKLQKVKEGTESAAVIRAEKDIRSADIIIFIIDISRKIDQNDLLIAHKLLKSAKPVIVACNKWDLVSEKEKDRSQNLLANVKRKLNFFYFAPFVLVSAKTGKNLFQLIDRAEAVHNKLTTKIKTSYINKVLPGILQEKKLLTETNRYFNPRYIAVESYKPFFINFHAGSGHKLKPSHEIYLKKRILEELGLEGIPVFFKITAKKRK